MEKSTASSITRCERCKRILTAPPIQHGGLSLGPVCAVRLGYVPPARENAGKAPKRASTRAPSKPRTVKDSLTPDLFADLIDYRAGPYLIAA